MHKCNLFTFVHQNATWLLKIMERNNDNANGIRHFCIVMFVCAGSWWPYIIAILVKANTKASEMVTNYFCFTIFEWIIFRFVCGARQPTQWFVLPCSMHENALYMENAPISLAQTHAHAAPVARHSVRVQFRLQNVLSGIQLDQRNEFTIISIAFLSLPKIGIKRILLVYCLLRLVYCKTASSTGNGCGSLCFAAKYPFL